MSSCVPVKVSKQAFFGCRWTVTAIVCLALVLQIKALLLLSFVIFIASALLGVRKAPLIVLYTSILPKKMQAEEILDQKAMRFAHYFGATLNGLALLFLYFISAPVGWGLTVVLALAKISGSFGFCGAQKLYGCLNSDTCCRAVKPRRHGN